MAVQGWSWYVQNKKAFARSSSTEYLFQKMLLSLKKNAGSGGIFQAFSSKICKNFQNSFCIEHLQTTAYENEAL